MTLGGIFRPGMRGYFVPFIGGLMLLLSAFLPWVIVGGVSRRGFPDMPALWVAGLGALASAVVGLLADGTALPMTGVMASCALIGLLILIIGSRKIRYKAKYEDIEEQAFDMIEKY